MIWSFWPELSTIHPAQFFPKSEVTGKVQEMFAGQTCMLIARANGWLYLLLLAIVLVPLLLLRLLNAYDRYPYEAKANLMSPAEMDFYHQIKVIVDDLFVVFPKVRIADVLKVRPGVPLVLKWEKKINCENVDFVLCDPNDLSIKVIIEMSYPDHSKEEKGQRDSFVDQAFEDARVPLIRIMNQRDYPGEKILAAIQNAGSARNRQWVVHVDI